MTAKKKKVEKVEVTEDENAAELEQLIQEYAVITDRIDALEDMKKQRKSRILLLMSEVGQGRFEGKAGVAAFQVRRSFKVHDAARLAELMSPTQLASLAKITADVWDALHEEVALDEAVTVGRSESLSVSRSKTKDAKQRRKAHIEESKRQAEARILDIRESFTTPRKSRA